MALNDYFHFYNNKRITRAPATARRQRRTIRVI